jgi:hypothetical protein
LAGQRVKRSQKCAPQMARIFFVSKPGDALQSLALVFLSYQLQ